MSASAALNVGIFGRGRLGSAVAALIGRTPGLGLAWTVGRGESPGQGADVALDASAAGAVGVHLAWAIATGTPLVVGTTGWDRSLIERLDQASLGIGVMVAPNFSLAVAFMRRAALALGRLAALEPDADLSIMERHHRAKADSPSGTARLLATAMAEGSGRRLGWNPGRAELDAIAIASLRSGMTVGYHELRYEAPRETIVLSHEALNRELFARGALEALLWIRDKRGLYSFDDLASSLIDPLFLPQAGRRALQGATSRRGGEPSTAGRQKETRNERA